MPGCKTCGRKWKTCEPLFDYPSCDVHTYIEPTEKEIKEWKKAHLLN